MTKTDKKPVLHAFLTRYKKNTLRKAEKKRDVIWQKAQKNSSLQPVHLGKDEGDHQFEADGSAVQI